jgi:hypothetical protein
MFWVQPVHAPHDGQPVFAAVVQVLARVWVPEFAVHVQVPLVTLQVAVQLWLVVQVQAAQVTVAVAWVPLTKRPDGQTRVFVQPVVVVDALFQVREVALSDVLVHPEQLVGSVPETLVAPWLAWKLPLLQVNLYRHVPPAVTV